jgi:hypothetical protein
VSLNYSHCLRPGTTVTTIDGGACGTVVGVAYLASPAVGHTYIVHLDLRSNEEWKAYPYDCAAIPRCLLKVHGTDNIVASYEGDVQFYEQSEKAPMVVKAVDVRRKLYEPYTLNFSFKDDDGDTYVVVAEAHSGVWEGKYEMFDEGTTHPLYHGSLYHVVVEDRQGTLILNATMEEAGSPQHITLRAKCVGEKAEVEDDEPPKDTMDESKTTQNREG